MHLTHLEMRQLLAATKGQRHEPRGYALLLLVCRHGLRASEACGMRLDQVSLESPQLEVLCLKNDLSTTHPFRADEPKASSAGSSGGPRETIHSLPGQARPPCLAPGRPPPHAGLRRARRDGCPGPPPHGAGRRAASSCPTRAGMRSLSGTMLDTGTSSTARSKSPRHRRCSAGSGGKLVSALPPRLGGGES